MAGINEVVGDGTKNPAVSGLLSAGLNLLSKNQEIAFTLYKKVILPVDGYVFYVKQASSVVKVSGALHYTTEMQQNVDETFGLNNVIFSAEEEIQEFNELDPTCIYIGAFKDIKFAFNSRRSYFQQAGFHHYVGKAVYPVMQTQLLDYAKDLPTDQILSNSIPIWMSIASVNVPSNLAPTTYQVYPEYLVTENLVPPYVVAHVVKTESLQLIPHVYNWIINDVVTTQIEQLVKDEVRLILYGFSNTQAMLYMNYIINYMTVNPNIMGLMGMPVLVDVPRIQSELRIRAQKKEIRFEVSYNQTTSLSSALRLITEAIPNFVVQELNGTAIDFTGYEVPPDPFNIG